MYFINQPMLPMKPSPLAGLGEAAGTLAQGIIQSRERAAMLEDYSLISKVLADSQSKTEPTEGMSEAGAPYTIPGKQQDMGNLIKETLPQMRTPQGAAALVNMALKMRPKDVYSQRGGQLVKAGTIPADAEIMKTDPEQLEYVRQEGRERLQDRRDALERQRQEYLDKRQEKALTAADERNLARIEGMLQAVTLRMKADKPLTVAQDTRNEEIDAARIALDKLNLDKDSILKATQATTATGRENPNYNPHIAKLVGLAGRRKYGDDPDFKTRYAWVPRLGPEAGGPAGYTDLGPGAGPPMGGPPKLKGFVRPGPYRGPNGKPVYIQTPDQYQRIFGG